MNWLWQCMEVNLFGQGGCGAFFLAPYDNDEGYIYVMECPQCGKKTNTMRMATHNYDPSLVVIDEHRED